MAHLNAHKLGCYLSPTHDPNAWKQYLFNIEPPVIRVLMPGDAPADLISQIHRICPDSKISLRWWDVDDGGEGNKNQKWQEPEAAGLRDAKVIVERIRRMEEDARTHGFPFPARSQLFANTANEPPVWEVNLRPAIATHAKTMVIALASEGIPTLALEMSVGHPWEWPPVWAWADPVFNALARNPGSGLALHEYWQPEGPMYEWTDNTGATRKDWGALAGRYQSCPYPGHIYITECGCDGRIYNRHPTPDTGWLKFMSAEAYAAQTGSYMAQVKKDVRIQAILPFITDFADSEWASFNTLPAEQQLMAVLHAMDKDDEGGPKTTTHIPVVVSPGLPVEPPPAPSGRLVVDPVVARAILQVESNGNGFQDGALKIRLEAHIFERYVAKNIFDAHFRYNPDNILEAYYRETIHTPWMNLHQNQTTEYYGLEIALGLNMNGAYESISMGAAQIMGFNAVRCGFKSAGDMYAKMVADPNYHLIGFFNYCYSDPDLLVAMKNKDWRTIAALYNGTGLVNIYAPRLEKAYQRLGGS